MIQKYSFLETTSEFEKYEENKLAEIAQELNSQEDDSDSSTVKEASASSVEVSDKEQNEKVKILDSKNNEIDQVISESNANLESKILNNESSKKESYFIEARLNTNIERERIISLLNEIINNEYTSEETRKKANEEKMKLIDAMNKEKIVENLIKSKGFNNALALITDHSVNIIVKSEKISDSEMAKILDIVVRETQASPDKIKIWNKF